MDQPDEPQDNRTKKVEGRAKQRRYVQGTRSYTHAVANSIAKRAGVKPGKGDEEPDVGVEDSRAPSH